MPQHSFCKDTEGISGLIEFHSAVTLKLKLEIVFLFSCTTLYKKEHPIKENVYNVYSNMMVRGQQLLNK